MNGTSDRAGVPDERNAVRLLRENIPMQRFMALVLAVLLPAVAWSQVSSDARNITRNQSAGQRFDAGNKWAVLVGVNRYLDPEINELEYCVADVRLMEKVLTERCGYESRRILVLADDQARDHLVPLRFNLDTQIRNWLLKAREGDTVLVFFSGHGFLDDRAQGFLAPKDCRKANLALSSFRTDDLRDMLLQCQASQKLLILDCCHAGGNKGADDIPSSEELGGTFRKAEGLITLASCRKKQNSQEWRAKGHGLFTYFLAAGMTGLADRDGNGIVDSDELYRYTFDEVPLAAQRELNKQQTPVRLIGDDVVGVFALARVAGRAAPAMQAQEVTAQFEVRDQPEQGRGKPVSQAQVQLLYRTDATSQTQPLATGTTDSEGRLDLKVKLTVEQQLRGEFLALVTSAGESRVWRLETFPRIRQWDLTVPVEASEFVNSVGMKLKLIPAGEFMMGSSQSAAEIARLFNEKEEDYADEHPTHRVQITRPYYLGAHEVTKGQFARFVSDANFKTEAEQDGEGGYGWNESAGEFEGRDPKYTWRFAGFDYEDDHPVVNVSWSDAVEFCKWLSQKESRSYRLPTEAEWEYACRAGTTTMYQGGDDPEDLVAVGNVADTTAKAKFTKYELSAITARDGYIFSAPVGRFRANNFGLFDMHGNVREWCSDWYDASYYATPAATKPDPVGPESDSDPFGALPIYSSRVLRGGGWGDAPQYCRSAFRDGSTPSNRDYFLGFRVSSSVQ
jgi:formylglycine-generating enzyme required for sulfatase activity/uncharacterized caspase-like protein